jgi:uncharacterized protein (TIGR03084 family)
LCEVPVDYESLLADLQAESGDLLAMVEHLTEDQLQAATPAEGWTIADQLRHIAYFDEALSRALGDPEAFRAEVAAVRDGAHDSFMARVVAELRSREADPVSWLQACRGQLLALLGETDPVRRIPWYGPDMSVASAATARLMETWAHGQDVADALGRTRQPTPRLRHVADLGVRTLGFSFLSHGLAVPAEPVSVELRAPGGGRWDWGQEGASNRVGGEALEFCLVVTQRRQVSNTGLSVEGPIAATWMSIAQAFAGGATTTASGR